MATRLVTALCALALAGCTSGPSSLALEQADYGTAPGSGHRRAIRVAFHDLLIDPDSARYEFGEPEQGWGQADDDYVFGWVVWTKVDSRNQFGAFTGWRDYKTLLTGDEVHSIYEPDGKDLFGNPRFRRLR